MKKIFSLIIDAVCGILFFKVIKKSLDTKIFDKNKHL